MFHLPLFLAGEKMLQSSFTDNKCESSTFLNSRLEPGVLWIRVDGRFRFGVEVLRLAFVTDAFTNVHSSTGLTSESRCVFRLEWLATEKLLSEILFRGIFFTFLELDGQN